MESPAEENLYGAAKIRKGGFFSIGRIFLTFWTEPQGSPEGALSRTTESGQRVFWSQRRCFVVIRNGDGYCNALPIFTLPRGAGHRGADKHDYTIIYTSRTPPPIMDAEKPREGEEPMFETPIRVLTDLNTDSLHPAARLNLGKIYTVKHNLKVKAFGRVHPNSLTDLSLQFQTVFLPAIKKHIHTNASEHAVGLSREVSLTSGTTEPSCPECGKGNSKRDTVVRPVTSDHSKTEQASYHYKCPYCHKLYVEAGGVEMAVYESPSKQLSKLYKEVDGFEMETDETHPRRLLGLYEEQQPASNDNINGEPDEEILAELGKELGEESNERPASRYVPAHGTFAPPATPSSQYAVDDYLESVPREPPQLSEPSQSPMYISTQLQLDEQNLLSHMDTRQQMLTNLLPASDKVLLNSLTNRPAVDELRPTLFVPDENKTQTGLASRSEIHSTGSKLPSMFSEESNNHTVTNPTTISSQQGRAKTAEARPPPAGLHVEDTVLTIQTKNVEADFEDTASIADFSDISNASVPPEIIQALLRVLNSRVKQELRMEDLNSLSISTLANIIQDFASVLRYGASSSTEKKASTLLRQRKSEVAVELKKADDNLDDDHKVPRLGSNHPGASVSPATVILAWIQDERDEQPDTSLLDCDDNIPAEIDASETSDDEPGPEEYPSNVEQQRQYLDQIDHMLSAERILWLASKIQAMAQLSISANTVSHQALPALRAASEKCGETTRLATLAVDWSPRRFLMARYTDAPLLSNVITLTTDGVHFQASACGDYVEQTWPLWGTAILKALEFSLVADQPEVLTIAEGFTICFEHSYLLRVTVQGSLLQLREVVEQMAWLACSFESNRLQNCITTPRLEVRDLSLIQMDGTGKFLLIATQQTQLLEDGDTCWQFLFNAASVASVFPVATRPATQKGMEMPLGIMMTLGQTDWATMFDNMFLFKGFSSMFYPVEQIMDNITWHFDCSLDRNYLSHAAAEAANFDWPDTLADKVAMLRDKRHFVGWAPIVQSSIATEHADYEMITHPRLQDSWAGLVFEKVTVTGGLYSTLSLAFARGDHQKAINPVSTDWYEDNLRAASSRPVVLYDTEAETGFLVTALEAIAHLSCARMRSKDFWLSDQDELPKGQRPFRYSNDLAPGSNTAMHFLMDRGNRQHVLRVKITPKPVNKFVDGKWTGEMENEVTLFTFEQLVNQMMEVLNKILDLGTSKTYLAELRLTPRYRLEGWSFTGIVRGELLKSKMKYVKPSGRGWADYIRSIGACTLLAEGLGNIYQAESPLTTCQNWRTVPPKHDYLAVRASTLKTFYRPAERSAWQKIVLQHTVKDDFPTMLAHGIYWHQPDLLFQNHDCGQASCSRDCRRIQVMLSEHIGRLKKVCKDEIEQHIDKGAVIFGQTPRDKNYWPSVKGSSTSTSIEPVRQPESDSGSEVEDYYDAQETPIREQELHIEEYVISGAERPSEGTEPRSMPGMPQFEIKSKRKWNALNRMQQSMATSA